MSVISIIGASGFIGKHLIEYLSTRGEFDLRVLVHRKKNFLAQRPNIKFIEGDLLKPQTLEPLFEAGCTVINLAYLSNQSYKNNIESAINLIDACVIKGVKKLIHCSTAVVTGKTSCDVISETTECFPVSEYQKTKLAIEKTLFEKAKDRVETTILRPTAVFGDGGLNLLKLANNLETGNRFKLYAKSCLFGYRSMNLVYVENVVAALGFLIETENNINEQIFIVSDDNSPINNYRDVEDRLIKNLGLSPYPFGRIPIPILLLKIILTLSNKPQPNPKAKYSDMKLAALGFEKPMSLEAGIDSFSSWFQRNSATSYSL